MPSRLALGNSTKASARFEALCRVMVRLSCIASGQGAGAVISVDGWQPAGFREGRVERAVGMAGAAASFAPSESPGRFGNSAGFRRDVGHMMMMLAVAALAPEINRPDDRDGNFDQNCQDHDQ